MAQRKKTEPIKAGADLPDLTEQQMEYVKGLLGGKGLAESYRAAYDCSKMSPNAVWVEASRLRHHPKISLWLSAARQAHLGSGTVTLESHIRELERLKEIAIATGNVGAAVQAEQLRGKAQGHYVERMDVTHHNSDALLDEIRQLSPELAAQLEATHH